MYDEIIADGMTKAECEAERDRRLNAYIEMLETVYQTDGYGIADMIGVSKSVWTRNLNAPWGRKSFTFVGGLCHLTGLRTDWLCFDFRGFNSKEK